MNDEEHFKNQKNFKETTCLDENHTVTSEKAIFFIGNMIGNSLFTLAFNKDNKKIYFLSNEWLYLLRRTPGGKMNPVCRPGRFENLKLNYNKIIKNPINTEYENYNVISFITSFSTGTVHGYAGLFCMIYNYLKNYEKYKNYKIIVYKHSQSGILDIINHFIKRGVFNENNIICLSQHINYLFNKIQFIPNTIHTFNEVGLNRIKFETEILKKYLINKNFNSLHSRICILKTNITKNITSVGIIKENEAIHFCKLHNLTLLKPDKMNEINLINTIYNCKTFVVSWGTAFFKNFIYLSDKCDRIIVLIYSKDYINQYNRVSHEYKKLFENKKIEVTYLIVDNIMDLKLNI